MIDNNYISSLPEASGNLTAGAYKNTANRSATVSSASNPQNIYIMHGANLTLSGSLPSNSRIYLMGTLTVNGTLNLGRGSSLNFGDGGFVAGAGSLIADEAKLDAPLQYIFAETINISGYWQIETAYPQWFTSQSPFSYFINNTNNTVNPNVSSSTFDWAIPIQRAIDMKVCGTVFIPKGVYTVSKMIKIPSGIKLQGANGININSMQLKGGGTIFAKMSGAPRNDTDYMISVNAKLTGNKWYINTQYLSNDTSIDSIRFEDLKQYSKLEKDTSARCIIVGGSATFRNLTWTNFKQGIKWAEGYADNRRIVQCNVNNSFSGEASNDENNITGSAVVFFLDLYTNGEGTIVEQCGINSKPYYSLRVGNNSGASIRDCVLNTPVYIRNAKAVSFTSNHMENASSFYNNYENQLVIYSSTIHIDSNYFEKGNKPCILINEAVDANVSNITASNNAFVVIGGKRESSTDPTSEFPEAQDRINSMSNYDISFNSYTNLVLINTYRYDTPKLSLAGNSYTLGIQLEAITQNGGVLYKNPFTEFNNKSYSLSQYCQIMGLKVITTQSLLYKTDSDYMSNCFVNSNCEWLYNGGTYNYKYAFLTEAQNPSTVTLKNISPNLEIGMTQFSPGVLLQVYCSNNGRKARLLLERSRTDVSNSDTKRVIVPICGTQIIYDNGLAIGGYKWENK